MARTKKKVTRRVSKKAAPKRSAKKGSARRQSNSRSSKARIAIIGGGNMGFAFARAFLNAGLCDQRSLTIIESDGEKRAVLGEHLGCEVVERLDSGIKRAAVIFLAVKPAESPAVCAALTPLLSSEQTVVSIMAGVRSQDLTEALGGHYNLVRCMPNTPVQCATGMTVFYVSRRLGNEARGQVEALLQSTGACLEVAQEQLLDAATAVSGSGPAYVFYVIEHFVKAAQELGFSSDEAEFLVAQTVVGSLGLWTSTGEQPAELRQRVTSKGGTTAAALEAFEEHAVGSALRDGIHRAFERSIELASTLKAEQKPAE